MKNIVNIYRWKNIKKGFFGGETLKGEYILFTFEHKNTVFLFQFMQHYKNDLYVVALADAFETPDYEVVQDFYDRFEYLANHETLENNIKAKVTMGASMKIVLEKPSKYIGKVIEIIPDSRLGRGLYMAKAKLAKGIEPAILYKKDEGDLGFAKKMRAYTAARAPKPKGGKKWIDA